MVRILGEQVTMYFIQTNVCMYVLHTHAHMHESTDIVHIRMYIQYINHYLSIKIGSYVHT